ncbi:MAG: hypothetical protein ACOX9C_03365 [Kiritimatiellia bacterium]|jgi:hypothetical protein
MMNCPGGKVRSKRTHHSSIITLYCLNYALLTSRSSLNGGGFAEWGFSPEGKKGKKSRGGAAWVAFCFHTETQKDTEIFVVLCVFCGYGCLTFET